MQQLLRFHAIQSLALVAVTAWATSALAVNIRIDYSMDASDFFGANNPQGSTGAAQAKAAMEAAADFYSGILGDTFSAIAPPTKSYGTLGGETNWFWKWRFFDPATGNNSATVNPMVDDDNQVDADEYVVFVGARDLPGNELGRGGPGTYTETMTQNGQFTADENTQIKQMQSDFLDAVSKRGESTGFAGWGGSIAFDSERNWHFDRTTEPGAGTQDFYSVALHELGHTLGLGASKEWDDLVDDENFTFTGANAVAAYDLAGDVPLESADDTAHWDSTIVDSTVYGSGVSQKPLMIPGLDPAMRYLLTDLDAAALVDLGWEIELQTEAAAATSNFVSTPSSSGSASFAALSASVAPEPTGLMLAAVASLFGLFFGSRRQRSRP